MTFSYIHHDNLVVLLDMFQKPGQFGFDVYLVMEMMEGNLDYVIRSSQEMDENLISFFLYQILRGLRVSIIDWDQDLADRKQYLGLRR